MKVCQWRENQGHASKQLAWNKFYNFNCNTKLSIVHEWEVRVQKQYIIHHPYNMKRNSKIQEWGYGIEEAEVRSWWDIRDHLPMALLASYMRTEITWKSKRNYTCFKANAIVSAKRLNQLAKGRRKIIFCHKTKRLAIMESQKETDIYTTIWQTIIICASKDFWHRCYGIQ